MSQENQEQKSADRSQYSSKDSGDQDQDQAQAVGKQSSRKRSQSNHYHVLKSLGVVGWDHLEGPILAALVSETPILLIGEHGTAKSMVLERLAEALDVKFRHYNASILNFDDLIGFPAPDAEAGRVRYLRSELDAWDAEAIFVDEISRCRPDMQNRLFPLIYDRKLQGAPLKNLKYRWSAMNPPPSEDDPNAYFGSFELDEAFADRYDWILRVPTNLSANHRLAIIKGTEVADNAAELLKEVMRATRGRLHLTEEVHGENIARFFDSLFLILQRRNYGVSYRRIRMMYKNAIAMVATGYYDSISDALYRTVLNSLPQNTSQEIRGSDIQPLIGMALKIQAVPMNDIRRKLMEETDEIKRVVLALQSGQQDLITATVLDSYSALTPAERVGLSTQLFPILMDYHPDTPAIVLMQLSDDVSKIQSLQSHTNLVMTHSERYQIAQKIVAKSSMLSKEHVWIEDVLWVAFEHELIEVTEEVESLVNFCRRLKGILAALKR
jgi:MoxR-like ATPase